MARRDLHGADAGPGVARKDGRQLACTLYKNVHIVLLSRMHTLRHLRGSQSALLTVRMSHALKSRIEEIAKAAKLSPSTVAKNILESILERVDNRLDVSADRARILQLERSAEEAKALWKQRVKEVEEFARSVAEKLEAARPDQADGAPPGRNPQGREARANKEMIPTPCPDVPLICRVRSCPGQDKRRSAAV